MFTTENNNLHSTLRASLLYSRDYSHIVITPFLRWVKIIAEYARYESPPFFEKAELWKQSNGNSEALLQTSTCCIEFTSIRPTSVISSQSCAEPKPHFGSHLQHRDWDFLVEILSTRSIFIKTACLCGFCVEFTSRHQLYSNSAKNYIWQKTKNDNFHLILCFERWVYCYACALLYTLYFLSYPAEIPQVFFNNTLGHQATFLLLFPNVPVWVRTVCWGDRYKIPNIFIDSKSATRRETVTHTFHCSMLWFTAHRLTTLVHDFNFYLRRSGYTAIPIFRLRYQMSGSLNKSPTIFFGIFPLQSGHCNQHGYLLCRTTSHYKQYKDRKKLRERICKTMGLIWLCF